MMGGRQEMLRKEYEERRARFVGNGTPAAPGGRPGGKRKRGGGCGGWFAALLVLLALAGAAAWFLRAGKGAADGTAEAAAEIAAETATAAGAAAATAGAPDAGLTEEETETLLAYFTPPESEMDQIYQFIVSSPHIRDNKLYAAAMDGVPLLFDADDDMVNAYAARNEVGTEEGKAEIWTITLCGGLVRYSRLLGLAAAMENARGGVLKRTVEDMPRSLLARSTLEDTAAFAAREGLAGALADETTRRFAKNFSSGMIMGALAHETGHHALGHLLGGEAAQDEGIRRDQEMQADLFASSITKASPVGNDSMLMGQLLFHYAVAMQTGEGEGDRNTGDHPLSRWRFETFVRQNEELAGSIGIHLD